MSALDRPADPAPDTVDTGPAVPPPAVRIRGLTKRYGQVTAVDHLDLDVPRGGIFGLIGPNGAGKTTTMLGIVTLLLPDAGSIEVFGADPRTDPMAVRARVGYMPDFFGLYDGLTCREYLDFFASAYDLAGEQRRAQVDDLLDLVELTHRADTDTSGLSRGMQQRLSLARALVHDPELLVLDEPASGLDPRARVEVREIMKALTGMGHTILVSSHILVELEEICDRVGIIQGGRVLAQGTTEELRDGLASALTVRVRVLGDDGQHGRALQVAQAAGAVHVPGGTGTLAFEVAGGEAAAADLLAALVAAGIRVVDFREEAGGLERLFLTVTERSGQ